MNSRKNIAAISAALILLSGCSDNKVSDISLSDLSASDVSEPSSTVSENTSEDAARNSAAADTSVGSEIPEEISNYISSLDNGDFVFVDYTFNDSPEVITDASLLGGAYDNALAALKETDAFARFTDDFSDAEQFGRFVSSHEDYSGGEPVFKRALTDDFDRDGDSESFILIGMPVIPEDEENGEFWFEREFLFTADENGAALLGDYYNAEFTAVLDYGSVKQVIVSSEGWNGNDSLSDIWQVNGDGASSLYGGRLTFQKNGCFLYSSGPQGIGDLAVYDLDAEKYLAIQGKPLDAADVLAMGELPQECLERLDDGWSFTLLGGKFFLLSDGYFEGRQFVYEDGSFKESGELVRISCTPGLTGKALDTLDNVNYDAALRNMISPNAADERITK